MPQPGHSACCPGSSEASLHWVLVRRALRGVHHLEAPVRRTISTYSQSLHKPRTEKIHPKFCRLLHGPVRKLVGGGRNLVQMRPGDHYYISPRHERASDLQRSKAACCYLGRLCKQVHRIRPRLDEGLPASPHSSTMLPMNTQWPSQVMQKNFPLPVKIPKREVWLLGICPS